MAHSPDPLPPESDSPTGAPVPLEVLAPPAKPEEGERQERDWPHWLLWLAAIFPAAWRQVTTSDCFWHIALGRWLVQHRTLPDFGQFYFTPSQPQVADLRWTAAGDVLFYLLHAMGGPVALQILSFACLVLGCVLLRRLAPGPMNGWKTLLLALVALGTYQLQLPRNAVFSLPLLALVFWLFARYRATRHWKWAAWLPAVIALWSVLHASALLGSALAALLLAVDTLEGLRGGARETWRRFRVAALAGLACLAVVVTGNPPALRLLQRPLEKITRLAAAKSAPDAAANPKASAPAPPAPRGPKQWLNTLIWPAAPGEVRSGDFSSPLDRLDYRPVGVAFVLMALALGWIFWSRALSLPFAAAFLVTGILGLGYFRMTGYASMGAAALLLCSGRGRGRLGEAFSLSTGVGSALTATLALISWGATLAGTLPHLLGNAPHVFGLGQAPTFDAAAARWLLTEHRDAPVFTTIVTGSYALEAWQGQKPVFIDGFFAPHRRSLWNDYASMRKEDDGPTLLRETYGIDFALVEHSRNDWNQLFLSDPQWQPAAIGTGCIIYGHRSVVGSAAPVLLFKAAAAEQLPPFYRRALARNYYSAILSMLAAERIEAAQSLISASPQIYQRLRRNLAREEKEAVRQMDAFLHQESPEGPSAPGQDER